MTDVVGHPPADRLEAWVSVKEFAEALGLNVKSVYRLTAARQLPYVRIGGTLRIPPFDHPLWKPCIVEAQPSVDELPDNLDDPEHLARLYASYLLHEGNNND